jgi:hypothetical protein
VNFCGLCGARVDDDDAQHEQSEQHQRAGADWIIQLVDARGVCPYCAPTSPRRGMRPRAIKVAACTEAAHRAQIQRCREILATPTTEEDP